MVTNCDAELFEPNRWSVEDEVHLLYSTLDNKPVGIDRHFHMSIICDKFVASSSKAVNSDILWKKLNSWYNLKSLDESEMLPFSNDEVEFKLPAELIPEQFLKNLSDEEKKNVDLSGGFKKYISLIDSEEDDSDSKSSFKLKGNDKVKWFENPSNRNDRTQSKQKSEDINDISRKFGDESDNKKVIRQYGKAGEVSSGTIVTLNLPSELDETLDEKEDEMKSTPIVEHKNINSDKVVKIKRTRSNKTAKTEASVSSDVESGFAKQSKIVQSESVASTTRSRKASIISQETSSGNETESKMRSPSRNAGDDGKNTVKRRFSQRCSLSESKNEPSNKSDSGKVEIKRKNLGRR